MVQCIEWRDMDSRTIVVHVIRVHRCVLASGLHFQVHFFMVVYITQVRGKVGLDYCSHWTSIISFLARLDRIRASSGDETVYTRDTLN